MHDLAIAAAFLLMVLSPCIVAVRSGVGTVMEAKEYFPLQGETE